MLLLLTKLKSNAIWILSGTTSFVQIDMLSMMDGAAWSMFCMKCKHVLATNVHLLL